MSRSNDKNLNITIKNNDVQRNEVIISLSTIIKKIKKYFLLWVVSAVVIFVLAFGYSILTTQITKPKLNALISFSYSGIEKGNDPKGRKFDVNTLKNPSVIERALTDLGMDVMLLESIRMGISIQGIIPSDAIDRITVYQNVYETAGNLNAAKEMLDVTYYPTQFKVFFDYNYTGLTTEEATAVFNEILDKYQDYFYEQYGYNESLGSAVTTISYESYDYSEAVDVFRNNLGTLRRYVKQLSNEDATRFRSAVTGYTFDDIYQAIKTIEDVDLDKITSYINLNNLTKDKNSAIAYYDYRMNTLNRQKTAYEEQLQSVQESIDAYEKDQIFIFSGTDNANPNLSSSVASDQYDNMIKRKLSITEDLAEAKQNINYYKMRKDALQNNPTGNAQMAENLDAQLKALSDKIDELIDITNQTSDDYYKNVTLRNAYNILVPATDTVSSRLSHIIDTAKLLVVVGEALGLFVFFMIAVVEAIVSDNKKAKAAIAAADCDEDDDDDDDDDDNEEEAEEKAEEKPSEKAPEKKNRKNK